MLDYLIPPTPMTESATDPPPLVTPDSSVAAKWYLHDEEHTEQARTIYRQFVDGSVLFAVPDCFYYELGNLIRTAERRGRIGPDRADEDLEAIAELPIYTFTGQFLLPLAGQRSRALNVSI
ncbi:MAG: type II toxin-antitoxin system VapC family toxin [Chloroflexi bacterium]|nr:type II toxin-antitoxin system VapC family toxin [Chloroflexota bacterium]